MWSWKNSLSTKYVMTIICSVFMRLEERILKTVDKRRGKIWIRRVTKQIFQERKWRNLHRGNHAEPFLFLHLKKIQPAVQLRTRNREAVTKLLYCRNVQKILCLSTKNEKQTITGVRDYKIWKDSMGMSTSTDETHDTEAMTNWHTIYKIDQWTVIISKNLTISFRSTTRTSL